MGVGISNSGVNASTMGYWVWVPSPVVGAKAVPVPVGAVPGIHGMLSSPKGIPWGSMGCCGGLLVYLVGDR